MKVNNLLYLKIAQVVSNFHLQLFSLFELDFFAAKNAQQKKITANHLGAGSQLAAADLQRMISQANVTWWLEGFV